MKQPYPSFKRNKLFLTVLLGVFIASVGSHAVDSWPRRYLSPLAKKKLSKSPSTPNTLGYLTKLGPEALSIAPPMPHMDRLKLIPAPTVTEYTPPPSIEGPKGEASSDLSDESAKVNWKDLYRFQERKPLMEGENLIEYNLNANPPSTNTPSQQPQSKEINPEDILMFFKKERTTPAGNKTETTVPFTIPAYELDSNNNEKEAPRSSASYRRI